MFGIKYKIVEGSVENIEAIKDEEIHYNFLLGNVSFFTEDCSIDMDWEWIPLLDFAFCLSKILLSLSEKDLSKESFEFTESSETIEFSKVGGSIKILASFSPTEIITTLDEFEKAVNNFHLDISKYVREYILDDESQSNLEKYLKPG